VIRPGFLDSESRQDLIELTRDGSAAHRLARRANALVLLDAGMKVGGAAAIVVTIAAMLKLLPGAAIDLGSPGTAIV